MEKKLQVLMELHPCFHGFSGIPQETRLLFSYFLNMPNVHSTGLINADVPHTLTEQLNTPKDAHEQINYLSKLIISLMQPGGFSIREKASIAISLWLLSIKNLLGLSIPMGHFSSKGFEDFLWEQLFAKTLTSNEYTCITTALFRSLNFSRWGLNRISWGRIFPKLDTKDYDVFLVQTPFPGRVAKNTQLVVRYHDAVPLFLPHLINNPKPHQASHYRALCSNAKTAVFACTSNDVRNDLLHIFPKLEKRSVVIYDTISPRYFEETTDRSHLVEIIRNYSYESRRLLSAADDKDDDYYHKHLQADSLNYILMVSTIEPRKNHIRLIRAWEKACIQSQLELKLILVGDLGWQVESILAAMKPWQQRGQLFHLQKVPVEIMRLLYQGAACVVCPSIKEGFDLSGIEAMACGGKVVASDIAVHREVYADAAVYFDPYSFHSQAEAIESVVKPGNTLASTLKEKGLKQVQHYQQAAIQPQWENFFDDIIKNKQDSVYI